MIYHLLYEYNNYNNTITIFHLYKLYIPYAKYHQEAHEDTRRHLVGPPGRWRLIGEQVAIRGRPGPSRSYTAPRIILQLEETAARPSAQISGMLMRISSDIGGPEGPEG